MNDTQQTRPVVLIIDDDMSALNYYARPLDRDYQVIPCHDPDEAVIAARQHGKHISLITLDIMMPPGKEFESSDTKKGLETGVLLYRHLRQECPQAHIIVLTHVENDDTLKKFPDEPLLVRVR